MNDESLNNTNVLDHLEEKLGKIAKAAKPLLDFINSEQGKISVSPRIHHKHIKKFLKITGKDALTPEDYLDLTLFTIARKTLAILLPDTVWKHMIPKMVQKFLSKDDVAGFLVPILRDIHELRKNLEVSAAEIEQFIDDNDADSDDNVNEFLKDKVIENLCEVFENIGEDEEDLKTLPSFVRTLLIQLLSTENKDIKS
jgi:hypothetical protein